MNLIYLNRATDNNLKIEDFQDVFWNEVHEKTDTPSFPPFDSMINLYDYILALGPIEIEIEKGEK